MRLFLTATPIMKTDGRGRTFYKNAAAKKLIRGCKIGSPVIEHLSAVGCDRYLRICSRNEEYGIIRFVNTETACRDAFAGAFDQAGERNTAFLFLSFLQQKEEDSFKEYAESVVIRAADELMRFVTLSGDIKNNVPLPRKAWNYTRRNTALYDISLGVSERTIKNAILPEMFLKMLKELTGSRMGNLSGRIVTDLRVSVINKVPIEELLRFTYTFLPSALLVIRSSSNGCAADISCENGAIGVNITADFCDKESLFSDFGGLAAFGTALDYDDIPSLIVADSMLLGDGIGFSCSVSDPDENGRRKLALEFFYPITEIRAAALFAPEEEIALERRVAVTLCEFFDASVAPYKDDGESVE